MTHLTLFCPQWQGGNNRAVAIGAQHLKNLLPDVGFITVGLDDEAPLEHDIKHYNTLNANFQSLHNVLAKQQPKTVAMLGGDCGSDGVVISYLNQRYQGDLLVLWLDAHADLNTPLSSPSKHYHGMPVRHLLGEGDETLQNTFFSKMMPSQVIYVGLRDTDKAEAERIAQDNISVITCEMLANNTQVLKELLANKGYSHIYVHLDMDILDPSAYAHSGYPTPNGLTSKTLWSVFEVLKLYQWVGGAVLEYLAITAYDLQIPKAFFEWVNAQIQLVK
jgi:arginase